MDVMLPLKDFVGVSHQQRRTAVCEALLAKVPRAIRKYSIRDFDAEWFLREVQAYVTNRLLGAGADRLDHLCLL
jgi:hypothetical protein